MTSISVTDDHLQRMEDDTPAFNMWWVRLPVLFFSAVLLLLAAAALLAGVALAQYRERIVPGVSVYGLSLGGMTLDEARAALTAHYTYDRETVFTFRDGDHFWQMTAGELGVRFDVEATLADAYAIGHNGGSFADFSSMGSAWLSGRDIAPIVSYDQNAAAERLRTIAADGRLQTAIQDAQLVIDGTTVTVTPPRAGRTLDISATLERLNQTILSQQSGGEIALVINETPPMITHVEAAAAQATTALSAPLTLTANAPDGTLLGPWIAMPEQIATLLTLELTDHPDGTRTYSVHFDASAFASYLAELAPGLALNPVDARFHFNENTAQLDVIQPAVMGRSLNIPATLAAMEVAVFDPQNRVVPLVFDYVLPRYHDGITAAELGITGMVAEATTYYRGSTENRRLNIARGASLYDGILIAPGEEFSFNEYLGDISIEAGFVEGKIIFGGRTIEGVGGGICQVSTNLFRAAFNAGFPFTERHTHGYRVGYYEQNSPPGLDAAIYTPTADLRFINDTPYHLLIETSMYPANDSIQVRFYSTNPGRTVEMVDHRVFNEVAPPAPAYEPNGELGAGQSLQVDWAATGAEVSYTRVIRDLAGNELRRDQFYTFYMPWQAVIQVPPGDARLSSSGG